MSFTMVVKDEASKIETTRLEDISELSAIIRIAGNINKNINVTIENNAVARRVFKLFKEIYGIRSYRLELLDESYEEVIRLIDEIRKK